MKKHNNNNNNRGVETTEIYGVDIILFEGILAFYHPAVRDLFDLKIFVDTDADIRLARRSKFIEMFIFTSLKIEFPFFLKFNFCLKKKIVYV